MLLLCWTVSVIHTVLFSVTMNDVSGKRISYIKSILTNHRGLKNLINGIEIESLLLGYISTKYSEAIERKLEGVFS